MFFAETIYGFTIWSWKQPNFSLSLCKPIHSFRSRLRFCGILEPKSGFAGGCWQMLTTIQWPVSRAEAVTKQFLTFWQHYTWTEVHRPGNAKYAKAAPVRNITLMSLMMYILYALTFWTQAASILPRDLQEDWSQHYRRLFQTADTSGKRSMWSSESQWQRSSVGTW